MRGVEDDLVVGVAVDGGHDAGRDAEGVVQDLDDGGQAVRGAGGVGNDVVVRRVVLVVVDAEDEGDVLVGGRGRDDDLLDGGAEVGLGLFGVGEEAGGFDDDSAPTVAQSSLAGSRSAKTLICLPSTVMESAPGVISCLRLPRMESYLSRWARVAGVVRSFTATNSMSGLPRALRKTLRPMRPKPLMPTLCCHDFGCACRGGRGYDGFDYWERGDMAWACHQDAITGGRAAQIWSAEALWVVGEVRGICEGLRRLL